MYTGLIREPMVPFVLKQKQQQQQKGYASVQKHLEFLQRCSCQKIGNRHCYASCLFGENPV